MQWIQRIFLTRFLDKIFSFLPFNDWKTIIGVTALALAAALPHWIESIDAIATAVCPNHPATPCILPWLFPAKAILVSFLAGVIKFSGMLGTVYTPAGLLHKPVKWVNKKADVRRTES